MKKVIYVIAAIVVSLAVGGQNQVPSSVKQVNLAQTKSKMPHIVCEHPQALFNNVSNVVSFELDNSNYSSYTIRLTPSNGGDDIVVNATSSTVTIPVTNTTADYVVTVDGGDYGVYDGVFSPSDKDSVTLSDTQVLRLVKNRREINTAVNYYSATVNTLVNDIHCCRIDTLPQLSWATDTTAKSLVFVDEHPDWSWSHECTYYYIPKKVSSNDSITKLSYAGFMPPRDILLHPAELNVTWTLNDYKPIPQSIASSLRTRAPLNPSNNDTKVILMASVGDMSDILTPGHRNWNECAALYSILTNKYNIVDEDIYILVGNEAGTVQVTAPNGYDLVTVPMPKDFDGDGTDENIIGFTETNLSSTLNELADQQTTGHFKHLFVFYAGHILHVWDPTLGVYEDESYLQISPSDYFPATTLGELLSCVNCDYTTILLNAENGNCAGSNMSKQDRIITMTSIDYYGSQSPCPHASHPEYSSFMYYWLNALAETDICTNTSVNSDANQDGSVTFGEMYNYSNAAYQNYIYNSVINEPNTLPSIYSWPTTLSSAISFTQAPRHSSLVIHQTADTSAIDWNSPDIWVRNQDDGFTHQQGEHIVLRAGEPVYVYLRIHNTGDSASGPNEKYVSLFAAPSDETLYGFFNLQSLGQRIGDFYTGTIAADTCAIYEYEWEWDAEPELGEGYEDSYDWQSIYASSGNVLPLRLVAFIGDDEYEYNDDEYHIMPAYRLGLKKHVEIEPEKCSTFVVNNGPMMPIVTHKGEFEYPVNLYGCDEGETYSIEIVADSIHSTSNLLNNTIVRVFLELDEELGDSLATGGTTQNVSLVSGTSRKYRLLNKNAKFSNIHLRPLDYTLKFSCQKDHGATYFSEIDWRFNVVIKNSAGKIVDGQSIRIYLAANPEIGPGIIHSTGPNIQSFGMPNGNYSLTETNISEPAQYEWLDVDLEKFGEGKSVIANKNNVGNYAVLKVTRYSDGLEQYAVASLDGVPAIASVTPVPFDSEISVNLTAGAVAGMSVRIVSGLGLAQPVEQAIVCGSENIVVNTASLPAGQYVVSLLHNNEVVQSVNVVK